MHSARQCINDIPDSKVKELSLYASKIGGQVVAEKNTEKTNEDEEVAHEVFWRKFKKIIKAFKSSSNI